MKTVIMILSSRAPKNPIANSSGTSTLFILTALFCILWSVQSKGQITTAMGPLDFEDTISLDPVHDWLNMHTGLADDWFIGMPDKRIFDTAHTGVLALMSDSARYYPGNCNREFYLTIPFLYNYWGEGILSFYHRYDTDTLSDGGYIDVSYDAGNTWMNVLEDTQHLNPIPVARQFELIMQYGSGTCFI